MYNQNQHLAQNAKSVLQNNQREQEERRLAMLREQKKRDLEKLETQLFYKKQEVVRLKTLHDRLAREVVLKQNKKLQEQNDIASEDRRLKDTERKITELDKNINSFLATVTEKIEREKQVILEKQKIVQDLEKQKNAFLIKEAVEKKSLAHTISNALFGKKKEEQEYKSADRIFTLNQREMQQIELSLKGFSQEITVLENKIRALQTSMKTTLS